MRRSAQHDMPGRVVKNDPVARSSTWFGAESADLRHAEIQNLHQPIVGDHDVPGLRSQMDDLGGGSFADLSATCAPTASTVAIAAKRPPARNWRRRLAFDELPSRYYITSSVVPISKIVTMLGMVDGGNRRGFLPESRFLIAVAQHVGGKTP